jgi:hypothetical protein
MARSDATTTNHRYGSNRRNYLTRSIQVESRQDETIELRDCVRRWINNEKTSVFTSWAMCLVDVYCESRTIPNDAQPDSTSRNRNRWPFVSVMHSSANAHLSRRRRRHFHLCVVRASDTCRPTSIDRLLSSRTMFMSRRI